MMKVNTKEELKDLIQDRIKEFGNKCDLSDIDVSNITDMSWMFNNSKFNQNINSWRLNKNCKYEGNVSNRSFKNMILTNKLNSL